MERKKLPEREGVHETQSKKSSFSKSLSPGQNWKSKSMVHSLSPPPLFHSLKWSLLWFTLNCFALQRLYYIYNSVLLLLFLILYFVGFLKEDYSWRDIEEHTWGFWAQGGVHCSLEQFLATLAPGRQELSVYDKRRLGWVCWWQPFSFRWYFALHTPRHYVFPSPDLQERW